MPHIVIEYSKNLHQQAVEHKLLQEIRNVVIASELFDEEAVKARAINYDEYILTETSSSFLHINISILEGRPLNSQQALLESVYAMAKGLMPLSDAVSVNIHEMMRETYKKS